MQTNTSFLFLKWPTSRTQTAASPFSFLQSIWETTRRQCHNKFLKVTVLPESMKIRYQSENTIEHNVVGRWVGRASVEISVLYTSIFYLRIAALNRVRYSLGTNPLCFEYNSSLLQAIFVFVNRRKKNGKVFLKFTHLLSQECKYSQH